MEGVLKSDIFFFITSIAIILVTAVFVAALVYIILILRDVKDITFRVKEEGKLISQDITELRSNIKQEGAKVKHFANFFGKMYGRNAGKKKRTKKTSTSEEKGE